MARIGGFADDDIVGWLGLSPTLGGALGSYADAVYNRGRLDARTRELARMVIAGHNECAVCRNTRAEASGLDEEFYLHVDDWATWAGYTPAERVAAEFAHRFATDHVGLREDEEFWERCHPALSDELIVDLALSCALWLGQGRALRVLDVGQACRLTV
ncbi:carboxymuconolactone decarboxylase family protein [Gordonia sp. ABSL11-1]|uniref:carboxymuconolactone decarboxylase family protein n=1 Tax=Gordonia sp. ABSL11-1 TaxID=3053924 RepID=UPI0025739144|nr:carboxymuconolactone decarboxylase family protein [Gordonia sp. ABSL11-1]MDL9946836.1 carboxymuconolactone decarboxylase family protein [Gordonia sp. ABSL11-1]